MTTKIFGAQVPSSALAIDRDYEGYVFVSDIDKTYLATKIDSIGGLLKAALENAERKNNVPGFSTLLRALRRGPHEAAQKNPLFFVSASPPQMRRKIETKMALDGIEHDGIIFKDQLEHVRRADFRKLKEQIGFKLFSLLALWLALPKKSRLLLFGDDSESDAIIYSLFSEIVACRVGSRELIALLGHLNVYREEALRVAWLSRNLRHSACHPVEAIYINLQTGSQPDYYSRLGPNVFATENTLQVALALYERKLIRTQALASIAKDMVLHHDFEAHDILRSLRGAVRRGFFSVSTLNSTWSILTELEALPLYSDKQIEEELGTLRHYEERRQLEELKLEEIQKAPAAVTKSILMELKKKYSPEGRY